MRAHTFKTQQPPIKVLQTHALALARGNNAYLRAVFQERPEAPGV